MGNTTKGSSQDPINLDPEYDSEIEEIEEMPLQLYADPVSTRMKVARKMLENVALHNLMRTEKPHGIHDWQWQLDREMFAKQLFDMSPFFKGEEMLEHQLWVWRKITEYYLTDNGGLTPLEYLEWQEDPQSQLPELMRSIQVIPRINPFSNVDDTTIQRLLSKWRGSRKKRFDSAKRILAMGARYTHEWDEGKIQKFAFQDLLQFGVNEELLWDAFLPIPLGWRVQRLGIGPVDPQDFIGPNAGTITLPNKATQLEQPMWSAPKRCSDTIGAIRKRRLKWSDPLTNTSNFWDVMFGVQRPPTKKRKILSETPSINQTMVNLTQDTNLTFAQNIVDTMYANFQAQGAFDLLEDQHSQFW